MIVCGDSHASTHGAFGALAFGIGTSEIEHVLALQCLPQDKPRSFRITIDGPLPTGVSAKDMILTVIARISTAGATGFVIEYAGSAIQGLSIEGRMTLCNMSIEAGARAGMIPPDEKTFAYLRGRRFAPKDSAWDVAVAHWRTLPMDEGARFDRELRIDAASIAPCVTWGTSPGMVVAVDDVVPEAPVENSSDRLPHLRALEYMDLQPRQTIESMPLTGSLLAPVPTRALKTFARPPRSSRLPACLTRSRPGRARFPADESTGRARRSPPDFSGRRFLLARGRLLHVPGHSSAPGNAAHPRRTAILKDARVGEIEVI